MLNSLGPVLQVTFKTASGPVLLHRHKMAAKTRHNNNLPFKILRQVISSQAPPFLLVSPLLLVLVPSLLQSTFPIQPK